MSVEALFKDLAKPDLVAMLCKVFGDDELLAGQHVAIHKVDTANAEAAAIHERMIKALDRSDFRSYEQLEKLHLAARKRAVQAWEEYQSITRRKDRRKPLEGELEDDGLTQTTSAERGLATAKRVVVEVAEAEFDDEPDRLTHRPAGLPHRPARLGLRR